MPYVMGFVSAVATFAGLVLGLVFVGAALGGRLPGGFELLIFAAISVYVGVLVVRRTATRPR